MSAEETGTNLDRVCAQYGWEMADKVYKELSKGAENHITKSLGVLQEDGVYAFFLYQASRGDQNLGKLTVKLFAEVKIDLVPKEITNIQQVLEEMRKPNGLADDIDKLLLAKRLLEQVLIYARYHVKAMEK